MVQTGFNSWGACGDHHELSRAFQASDPIGCMRKHGMIRDRPVKPRCEYQRKVFAKMDRSALFSLTLIWRLRGRYCGNVRREWRSTCGAVWMICVRRFPQSARCLCCWLLFHHVAGHRTEVRSTTGALHTCGREVKFLDPAMMTCS